MKYIYEIHQLSIEPSNIKITYVQCLSFRTSLKTTTPTPSHKGPLEIKSMLLVFEELEILTISENP